MSLNGSKSLLESIDEIWERTESAKKADDYYYFQAITALDNSSAWVSTSEGKKLMFATYNYLGLLGDPRINEAAIKAVEKYGTGTHGVRIFGGSLDLHEELEDKIANFTNRESAIVYSTGYMTNLATINSLVSAVDWIISDRLNHASIVDGCLISRAQFKRFKHNDMEDLERLIKACSGKCYKACDSRCGFLAWTEIFLTFLLLRNYVKNMVQY